MKIEFGFQSNCSEIVTLLGFTERKDILRALKKIVKVTGWKLGAEVGSYRGERKIIILAVNKLETLLIFHEKNDTFWIDNEQFVRVFRKKLTEKEIHALVHDEDDLSFGPSLALYNPENINQKVDFSSGTPWSDDAKGLSLMIGHTDEYGIPIIHAVKKAFNSTIESAHLDSYYEWLKFHFIDHKDDNQDDVHYPPVNKYQKLSKEEYDTLNDWISFQEKKKEKVRLQKKESQEFWNIILIVTFLLSTCCLYILYYTTDKEGAFFFSCLFVSWFILAFLNRFYW